MPHTSSYTSTNVQVTMETHVCTPNNFSIIVIALFYYTLGNISPKYRSRMRCIQLLTVVKSTVLQTYGVDTILEPFMEDLKALEQVLTY